MRSSLSRVQLTVAGVMIAASSALVGALLMSIPPVVGLGDKVKLPLYHGGSTWVNLVIFTLMGLAAVVHLIGRNERAYAWEVGFRTVGAPLWLTNSVLGFIAASSTWDFSASKESPLSVIPSDPRLSAQIVLLLGVFILMLADWLVFEKRAYKAVVDILYVVAMWGLMASIFLDPVKRALHPDSPVMNSGWEIKLPFFGMVAAIFIAMVLLSWVASSFVRANSVSVDEDDGARAPSSADKPSAVDSI